MKIILDPNAEVILRAWTVTIRNEFSGLADVVRIDGDLWIVNPHVLDVGTYGFTDFTPDMIRSLPASSERRCWHHRHPIECWSGTDINTMTTTPCGSIPEMIQWAVAIVWTPAGWLGRLDTFVPTKRHFDLEVVALTPENAIIEMALEYANRNHINLKANLLHQAFVERHKKDFVPDEAPMPKQKFQEEYLSVWPGHDTADKKLKKPAPRKKNFFQKAFPWLLDEPKGE